MSVSAIQIKNSEKETRLKMHMRVTAASSSATVEIQSVTSSRKKMRRTQSMFKNVRGVKEVCEVKNP